MKFNRLSPNVVCVRSCVVILVPGSFVCDCAYMNVGLRTSCDWPHPPHPLTSSLTLNHISLSDMGTPGQTHTPSFSLCLSTQINSHSSRALSCLKLHLWIIDRLLPQRLQRGIMRIKMRRAGKAERERGGRRGWRTEEEGWPSANALPSTKPKQNTCFVRVWAYCVESLLDFFNHLAVIVVLVQWVIMNWCPVCVAAWYWECQHGSDFVLLSLV